MKIVTRKMLSEILLAAFERDGWGLMDPGDFRWAALDPDLEDEEDDRDDEIASLREVLDYAVLKLNEELNGK